MRLVMMGTGRFALPTFLSLYELQTATATQPLRFEVVGLFTQPDRTGRGHHQHPHPMKEAAVERGTPVFQPDNVNSPESLQQLRDLSPDVCVVAAYGQILSAEMLAIPTWGSFNLHASLLPKYRGAAPIQYAVLNGDAETGVTIFRIEPKLDAGPMLAVERIPIDNDDTSGDVEPKLAQLAVPMTQRVLTAIAGGNCDGELQDATGVTKAPKIRKEHGLIPWTKSAVAIHNHIRGMQPWPGAYTFFELPNRSPLRVLVTKSRVLSVGDLSESQASGDTIPNDIEQDIAPGVILPGVPARLFVGTGDGVIELLEVKPEGKRAMPADAFLRGHDIQPGCRCG